MQPAEFIVIKNPQTHKNEFSLSAKQNNLFYRPRPYPCTYKIPKFNNKFLNKNFETNKMTQLIEKAKEIISITTIDSNPSDPDKLKKSLSPYLMRAQFPDTVLSTKNSIDEEINKLVNKILIQKEALDKIERDTKKNYTNYIPKSNKISLNIALKHLEKARKIQAQISDSMRNTNSLNNEMQYLKILDKKEWPGLTINNKSNNKSNSNNYVFSTEFSKLGRTNKSSSCSDFKQPRKSDILDNCFKSQEIAKEVIPYNNDWIQDTKEEFKLRNLKKNLMKIQIKTHNANDDNQLLSQEEKLIQALRKKHNGISSSITYNPFKSSEPGNTYNSRNKTPSGIGLNTKFKSFSLPVMKSNPYLCNITSKYMSNHSIKPVKPEKLLINSNSLSCLNIKQGLGFNKITKSQDKLLKVFHPNLNVLNNLKQSPKSSSLFRKKLDVLENCNEQIKKSNDEKLREIELELNY